MKYFLILAILLTNVIRCCCQESDSLTTCDLPKLTILDLPGKVINLNKIDINKINGAPIIDTFFNFREIYKSNRFESIEAYRYKKSRVLRFVMSHQDYYTIFFVDASFNIYQFYQFDKKQCTYRDIYINYETNISASFFCEYDVPNNCFEENFREGMLILRNEYIPFTFAKPESINKYKNGVLGLKNVVPLENINKIE